MDKRKPYDPLFFLSLVRCEADHFWFRSRNDLLLRSFTRVKELLTGPARILEVGCGTGNALRLLLRAFSGELVIGCDLLEEGLRMAGMPSRIAFVVADLRRLPFAASGFSLIGMFDVLEHIPDDEAALREIRECLAPGGRLILTVPAHPCLWSYFDVASGHWRRYRRGELYDKLRAAGYCVEFISGFMMLLLPLTWLWRKVLRRRARAVAHREVHELAVQEFRVIPVLNGILEKLLKLEAWWVGSGRRLPSGTSWIAIARRCS